MCDVSWHAQALLKPPSKQHTAWIAALHLDVNLGNASHRLVESGRQHGAPWCRARPRKIGIARCVVVKSHAERFKVVSVHERVSDASLGMATNVIGCWVKWT